MTPITKTILAVSVLAALAAGVLPASAHTNVVIAGFQIVPGGSVNGYGVAPNQTVDDGPATDGTVIWVNVDPVAHRLVGTCVARPSAGTRCTIGSTGFDVSVQPGAQKEISGLPLGTYAYGDPAYPTMRARFRVTSSE